MRIACEAVTNAARHSGASRVNLGLEREGSGVRMRVSDKGHGFDTAAPGWRIRPYLDAGACSLSWR